MSGLPRDYLRVFMLVLPLCIMIAQPNASAYPGAHRTLACIDCHLSEPDPAVDTEETVTFRAPNAEELCLGCHEDQRYTEVHNSPVNYKHPSSGTVPMSMYAQYQAWIGAHGSEYSPELTESALRLTPLVGGGGYRFSCNTCHVGMGSGYPRVPMTNLELCVACHGGRGNADSAGADPRFSSSPRVLYNPTHLGVNNGVEEYPVPSGAPSDGDLVTGQVPLPYAVAFSFHTNVNENLGFRLTIDHGDDSSIESTQEFPDLIPMRWHTNGGDPASPRWTNEKPLLLLDSTPWPGGSHRVDLIPRNPMTQVAGNPVSLTLNTAVAPSARIPVILIPGVMATKLYAGSELVWIETMDFLPPGDTFLDPLELTPGGQDKDSTRQINLFRGGGASDSFSFWNQHILADEYRGVYDQLTLEEGYTPSDASNVGDFTFFAYDWRKAPNDEAAVVDQLQARIMEITNNGQQQVDLVAHSLGGLVLKAYLQKYGPQNLVRKAITVGTPHVGLAKAFRSLQFGWWGFGWLGDMFVNENEIMKISQNWRVPYAGIPDDAYYSNAGYGAIFKERDVDMDNDGIVSGEWDNLKVRDYLNGGIYYRWWWANPTPETDPERRHNGTLAGEGTIFHSDTDQLSGWADKATEVHLIASRGLATLSQMELYNPYDPNFENAWALTSHVESGDGTVPTRSASLSNDTSSSQNVSRYWVMNGVHADLLNANDTVLQLVSDILASRTSQIPGVETAAPTSDSVTAIELEVDCPVDVHIYDAQGNHVGPTGDARIERGIADVVYERVSSFDGYTTTAYLPPDRPFTILFNAIGSGSFRVTLRNIEHGVITGTAIYDGMSLLPETRGYFEVSSPMAFGVLVVDQDGDGVADQEIAAKAQIAGDERDDHEAPITPITLQGTAGENGYYRSEVAVFLTPYDTSGGAGVQRTEYRVGDGSWLPYAGSFPLTSECGVEIGYRSIDFGHNREPEQRSHVLIDLTGPVVSSFTVTPNVLWPPNHQLIEVLPAVATSDNCGEPVSWRVKSITMNEGDLENTYDPLFDQQVEDGDTAGDMEVVNGRIYLRAERAGNSEGRSYRITLSAQDRAGNETLAQAVVSVPHDQR